MKMNYLIIILALVMTSCAHQLMSKSVLLEPGMSKKELVELMGVPGNRQFKGNKEAWQYCETGGMADDYITVWLINGAVAGTQSYHNTGMGFCSSYFKTVNWEEAPDAVLEIRNR